MLARCRSAASACDAHVKTIARTSLHGVAQAVTHAAQRWTDADFPPRVRAARRIAGRTGYSDPMVDYALDRLFETIDERAIDAAIREEVAAQAAAPAGSVCILSSRTTIGVAIPPAIFALCAGCTVLVKDREDALASAFFETVREEAAFPLAITARAWSSPAEDAPDLRAFDVVVAFGSDASLEAIRRRMKPGARFVAHGSRASAGYVPASALADRSTWPAIAEGAARDLVLYETQGCLSLHVLFAECASVPPEFGSALASAVERASVEFPVGRIDPALGAAALQYRRLAAFRSISDGRAVWSDGSSYAIVASPPSEPPPLLPRILPIVAVRTAADASAYLLRHGITLEALAAPDTSLAVRDFAARSGASRVCAFGDLQRPPFQARHGGHARILPFVRAGGAAR